MLILDKPEPFDGETIVLPIYHRAHLSLFKESGVSVVVLPPKDQARQLAELIISPIREDSWDDLWRASLTLYDRKGLVKDVLQVLARHDLNVLAAESSSMEREAEHLIDIIFDARRYQTPFSDGDYALRSRGVIQELNDLKRYLIAQLLPDLVIGAGGTPRLLIRRMRALFNARRALDEADAAYKSSQSTFRPVRGRARLEKVDSSEYVVRLNEDLRLGLKNLLGNSGSEPRYLRVSDTQQRFLRVHFTNGNEHVFAPTIRHVERPGAIAEMTNIIHACNFNILTMLSRLADHNRAAETEFVLTCSSDIKNPRGVLEAALSTEDLIREYGLQIAYPDSYSGQRKFRHLAPQSSETARVPRYAELPSVSEQLLTQVHRYSTVISRTGSSQEDAQRLRIARLHHSEEVEVIGKRAAKILFLSCAYGAEYLQKAKETARNYGFIVLTGEEVDQPTKRSGVEQKIRSSTHFLGIWTCEGGFPMQERRADNLPYYWPSPWMNWEVGVAQAHNLMIALAISRELHPECWRKIYADPPHCMFDGSNFPDALDRVLISLAKQERAS